EDIYTVPNLLTFTRLVLSPVLGYFVLHGQFGYAFGLFVYMGATDFVDGYIARRFNQRTMLGTVLDPLADKVLMTTLTVTLMSADRLPVYLGAMILGRDLGLLAASFTYRWMTLPEPRSFQRYWDLSLPTAEVTPSALSKLNTVLQLLLMGTSLALPAFSMPELFFMEPLSYTVAATTALSTIQYLIKPPIRRL
ncbi:CDP-alcohol phosphatidyltransferase-domain-containing protein, partial [Hyaloraphidium curvatum]